MTLAIVSLDGKLLGPWVDEARSVIAALPANEAVRLNLANLSFADAAGIELLRAARRDGIQFVGASPLIEGLLAAHDQSAATSDCKSARE